MCIATNDAGFNNQENNSGDGLGSLFRLSWHCDNTIVYQRHGYKYI